MKKRAPSTRGPAAGRPRVTPGASSRVESVDLNPIAEAAPGQDRTPLDRLLDDLMTNALGQEAERLVLMGKGKRDLGGWSRHGLRAAIVRVFPELEAKR